MTQQAEQATTEPTISNPGDDISDLVPSFERYLRATNKAPKTINKESDRSDPRRKAH